MALRRRFLPVFKKHAPRGMARFAKSLQGPFGPAAKHSQKHKNRPEIGRFSHFNPSAEMYPFSPFSTSKAPEKWLCTAVCRKKQLFAGSFVSRSHSFCSFTATEEEKAKEGRQLFSDIEKKDIRIRPKCQEAFIMRGSYHILANQLKIGWHVDFFDRLKQLLNT